ncbi:unnamed protein product [Paramecium sonneborni]|uniref:Uncharacterized protein n=1 Tax=Paramecium sonneborni TaxID=65129 RepID=A0A8S1LZ15_9CILI|nr:unnamed protein product [Paramecium sonneborni]
MDIFKDLFATQGFQLCVKAVQDVQPNGDQEALFKQCQQNYANAYKVVGQEFLRFFNNQPSKDRYGPPEDI